VKNKNQQKLKLTKLTVANLDRVKGREHPCQCDVITHNLVYNLVHYTEGCSVKSCIVCPLP
jgi:hypothetical protein